VFGVFVFVRVGLGGVLVGGGGGVVM